MSDAFNDLRRTIRHHRPKKSHAEKMATAIACVDPERVTVDTRVYWQDEIAAANRRGAITNAQAERLHELIKRRFSPYALVYRRRK